MEERSCWLCGRNGCGDPLDRHHIFGGANRKKSEKYGLVVLLCHSRCHLSGEKAAHRQAILHTDGLSKCADGLERLVLPYLQDAHIDSRQ